MNIEYLRNYCLSKPGAEETFPFDEETLVFKFAGKIFLIVGIESLPLRFNVKCNPEIALELRSKYPCVLPGFHMNKKHWNTVICGGSVPKKLYLDWIDNSYNLIANGIPKNKKTN